MTTAAWEHPDWDDAWFAIVDMLGVDEVVADERDMVLQAALANAGSKSSAKSMTATVAAHPDVVRLFHQFQSLVQTELYEARIFGNLDDARAWGMTARPRPRPLFGM